MYIIVSFKFNDLKLQNSHRVYLWQDETVWDLNSPTFPIQKRTMACA